MTKKGETLALRIKHLREQADLTLQELATRSGLSISAVVQIEGGHKRDPRLSTLQALATGLGVSVNRIIENLGGVPETFAEKKRKGKR